LHVFLTWNVIKQIEEVAMNKDQAKGKIDQTKGKIKEIAGKTTGNKDLENKGTAQKIGGKVREAYGDVKGGLKKKG